VVGVSTHKAKYSAPVVIDAAGPFSAPLCKTANCSITVIPDSHEAAVTEPVQPFLKCMVVDIRPEPGSKNFYFYQNQHGQVVFCLTPDPPIVGTDKGETSRFLPQACERMVRLIPRLKNLRVRRTWRGLYPMTPDGSPLVGWNKNVQGLLLAPGLAEVVVRLIAGETNKTDQKILKAFSPYGKFKGQEALK